MYSDFHSLSDILDQLPGDFELHSTSSPAYQIYNKSVVELLADSDLDDPVSGSIFLEQFGSVIFPYVSMGSVDSIDLFYLNELIIFSYYWVNRSRYSRVADVGANLGLHSLIMEKCGWNVTGYEPDPQNVHLYNRNLELNDSQLVEVIDAAVSDFAGIREFVRVLGNTTGSHLVGSKQHPYGEIEKFPVRVVSADEIFTDFDLIKLDVEGSEASIVEATERTHWLATELIAEIGNRENASRIFRHLSELEVNCFSQKIGWSMVKTVEEMPTSYREGSVFCSIGKSMNWLDPEG